MSLERTLAIVKPDGIQHEKAIRDAIEHGGFTILGDRKVELTSEQVSDLFSDQIGKHTWPIFLAHMSSGPITVLDLGCVNAVLRWNTMMVPENPMEARESHPDCLRALYGGDIVKNALHGSANILQAQKEIQFFFPQNLVEPLLSGAEADDFLSKQVRPTLDRGLIKLCETKPADPRQWLADWLSANNPNTPQIE